MSELDDISKSIGEQQHLLNDLKRVFCHNSNVDQISALNTEIDEPTNVACIEVTASTFDFSDRLLLDDMQNRMSSIRNQLNEFQSYRQNEDNFFQNVENKNISPNILLADEQRTSQETIRRLEEQIKHLRLSTNIEVVKREKLESENEKLRQKIEQSDKNASVLRVQKVKQLETHRTERDSLLANITLLQKSLDQFSSDSRDQNKAIEELGSSLNEITLHRDTLVKENSLLCSQISDARKEHSIVQCQFDCQTDKIIELQSKIEMDRVHISEMELKLAALQRESDINRDAILIKSRLELDESLSAYKQKCAECVALQSTVSALDEVILRTKSEHTDSINMVTREHQDVISDKDMEISSLSQQVAESASMVSKLKIRLKRELRESEVLRERIKQMDEQIDQLSKQSQVQELHELMTTHLEEHSVEDFSRLGSVQDVSTDTFDLTSANLLLPLDSARSHGNSDNKENIDRVATIPPLCTKDATVGSRDSTCQFDYKPTDKCHDDFQCESDVCKFDPFILNKFRQFVQCVVYLCNFSDDLSSDVNSHTHLQCFLLTSVVANVCRLLPDVLQPKPDIQKFLAYSSITFGNVFSLLDSCLHIVCKILTSITSIHNYQTQTFNNIDNDNLVSSNLVSSDKSRSNDLYSDLHQLISQLNAIPSVTSSSLADSQLMENFEILKQEFSAQNTHFENTLGDICWEVINVSQSIDKNNCIDSHITQQLQPCLNAKHDICLSEDKLIVPNLDVESVFDRTEIRTHWKKSEERYQKLIYITSQLFICIRSFISYIETNQSHLDISLNNAVLAPKTEGTQDDSNVSQNYMFSQTDNCREHVSIELDYNNTLSEMNRIFYDKFHEDICSNIDQNAVISQNFLPTDSQFNESIYHPQTSNSDRNNILYRGLSRLVTWYESQLNDLHTKCSHLENDLSMGYAEINQLNNDLLAYKHVLDSHGNVISRNDNALPLCNKDLHEWEMLAETGNKNSNYIEKSVEQFTQTLIQHSDIQQFEDSLMNYDIELSNLKLVLCESHTKCNQLEIDRSECMSRIQELQTQTETLTEKLNEARHASESQQQHCNFLIQRDHELTNHLSQLKEKYDLLNSQQIAVRYQEDTYSQQMDVVCEREVSMVSENERLKKLIELSNLKLEEYEKQLKSANEMNSTFIERESFWNIKEKDFLRQLDDCNTQYVTIKSELDNMTLAFNDITEREKMFHDEKLTYRQEIEKLNDTIHTERSLMAVNLDEIKQEHITLQHNIEHLNASHLSELNAIKCQLHESEHRYNELTAEKIKLSDEIVALTRLLFEREHEIEANREQMIRLEEYTKIVSSTHRLIEVLEANIGLSEDQLQASFSARVDYFIENINSLVTRVGDCENTILSYKDHIMVLENSNSQLSTNCSDLQHKIEHMTNDYIEKSSFSANKEQEIRNELTAICEQRDNYIKKIDEINQAISLEQNLRLSLASELTVVREHLQTVETERNYFREKFNELDCKNAEHVNQIQSLQSKYDECYSMLTNCTQAKEHLQHLAELYSDECSRLGQIIESERHEHTNKVESLVHSADVRQKDLSAKIDEHLQTNTTLSKQLDECVLQLGFHDQLKSDFQQLCDNYSKVSVALNIFEEEKRQRESYYEKLVDGYSQTDGEGAKLLSLSCENCQQLQIKLDACDSELQKSKIRIGKQISKLNLLQLPKPVASDKCDHVCSADSVTHGGLQSVEGVFASCRDKDVKELTSIISSRQAIIESLSKELETVKNSRDLLEADIRRWRTLVVLHDPTGHGEEVFVRIYSHMKERESHIRKLNDNIAQLIEERDFYQWTRYSKTSDKSQTDVNDSLIDKIAELDKINYLLNEKFCQEFNAREQLQEALENRLFPNEQK